MLNKYWTGVFFGVCLLTAAYANTPIKQIALGNTCPSPSENALRCLGEWACKHAIRLDLRCLLNVNGVPLLGGLLGGSGLGGLLGGGGGGGGGGAGGLGGLGGGGGGGADNLLGSLLGR